MRPETAEQARRHLNEAIHTLCANGWTHEYDCVFKSPEGTLHDMSAANISKHKLILRKKLFLVRPL